RAAASKIFFWRGIGRAPAVLRRWKARFEADILPPKPFSKPRGSPENFCSPTCLRRDFARVGNAMDAQAHDAGATLAPDGRRWLGNWTQRRIRHFHQTIQSMMNYPLGGLHGAEV